MVVVEEIKDTSVVASLVARSIADSLERRMPFRRVMKRAADNAARNSYGIKICCAGRLAGAEIARASGCAAGRCLCTLSKRTLTTQKHAQAQPTVSSGLRFGST